ncbi:MAG: acetate--CoA ligase family protein [Armatimonadota bacterium]|nr:acetate--CoA ligase family protein [Armatimonadota bacterium]MDR7450913.1 acetate--CoA ligase family protein [Armatimonadota bacterium]MDR7465835.1 acetate--CoA ligase family protein [Armatimonadota bacterium]MDR7493743.1 acetate--CoA ligase family protein [Armatimonadota bacterium]MDR7498349.1 acetate--CoA ligase family protein [Armatimonadota bacterium]
MEPALRPFFAPRGIALIGASREPGKLGFGVAQNLVNSGYRGALHFVNPRGGTLLGRPVYEDVALVPDPVDLAVLIIPAPTVAETLRACGRRGIRAAIILSGGFREIGPPGEALEAECLRAAREYGMRLLGPNCVGVIDTHLPLDATFLSPPGPGKGDVAFISHSGAICAAVTDWARGQGFGLSRLISLGNQLDVTETDVLGPVGADPHTRVITLYLEGITTGRRFVQAARAVASAKPVIALKVGRSAAGQRAVASHTGALAGQEAAYNAAFERAGVIRADTSEEMFNWARALAWCPLPAGRSMAVLTNAGGPGVIAADALEAHGLTLAALNSATQDGLRRLLPPFASTANPVDILASATPEQYAASLRLLLDDPDVHGVLVILPPPPRVPAEAVADALIAVIREATKPVVVALMGELAVREAATRLRAARIPDYRFPEQAASALAALVRRREMLARPQEEPARPEGLRPELVRSLIDAQRAEFGPAFAQAPAARLLAAYGIGVAPMELARTPEEAVRIAEHLGFPVALKVASPDILHKSDIGGVALDVADRRAVARTFDDILGRTRQTRPQARVHGVCVQPMLPRGQEVIVGAVQDPQFGPLVMFGSGGLEVESLRDVAFALAPLSRGEAEALLDRTAAGRRLQGFRGWPAGDRAAVIETILRLGQLAADFSELQEVEINPLLVYPHGVAAVDTRIVLR